MDRLRSLVEPEEAPCRDGPALLDSDPKSFITVDQTAGWADTCGTSREIVQYEDQAEDKIP